MRWWQGVAAWVAALCLTGTAAAQTRPTWIGAIACGTARAAVPTPPPLVWRGSTVPWAEWPVALGVRRVANTLLVVDVDPARVSLELALVRDGEAIAPWSLDAAPPDAVLALNAGQFTDEGPWGWVVHRGREWQGPGAGTHAGALVITRDGAARIITADSLAAVRAVADALEAVQSYPLILDAGRASPAVCGPAAVDLAHRDIRLVVGTRADGHLLLVLSRYRGVGAAGERLPIGPTTAEMAEVMRRLGAQRALMLDGGLSAQLLLRDGGTTRQWPGLRRVPLALVGRVRR